MRFRMLTPVTMVALAFGAVACGSDDSKLSKKDLGTKAGAICKKYKDQVDAVPKPSDARDAAQAATYLDKVSPVVSKGVDKLKELKPADDVKSDYDAFLAKEEEGAKLIEGAAKKATAKDPSALKDLQKLDSVGADAKVAAQKAGATGCAQ